MFVTSDIFDLKAIGGRWDFDWQENLLGGVVVHGTTWRGYQSAADYMYGVAERCGLVDELEYASYSRAGDKRQHFIKPTSFGRLARGELAGAKNAESILLRGERQADGSRRGSMLFGGEASSFGRIAANSSPTFEADFCFPIDERPRETASEIMRQSVEKLDAEYGYYFVRDDLCGPAFYAWGISPILDFDRPSMEEREDTSGWYDYVRECQIWADSFPLLRDLYEVNLISERHTSVRTGLGYITDWIMAGPGRGKLEDLGRCRLLWTLTDQEMFDVRPVLNEAGLLKSCRDRIYRDLHPGTGVKPYADPRCHPPIRRPSRERSSHG